MAKYSAMSIENRFDRWMSERDLKETVGKSYEDYKEALRNTPNNWFTDEKGQIFKEFNLILWRFQIFKINPSISCFSVIEKWLKDGLRKLDDGTFKSRVHPFIRQWGTAHWSLSTEEAYELTKNFDSDLMYLKVSRKGKILIKKLFLLVWSKPFLRIILRFNLVNKYHQPDFVEFKTDFSRQEKKLQSRKISISS